MSRAEQTTRIPGPASQISTSPLTGSRKVYLLGKQGVQVPFREVTLSPKPSRTGAVEAAPPPVMLYDTSGPYTDPAVTIDVHTVEAVGGNGIDGEEIGQRCGHLHGAFNQGLETVKLSPLTETTNCRRPSVAGPVLSTPWAFQVAPWQGQSKPVPT